MLLLRQGLGLIKYWKGSHLIHADPKIVAEHYAKYAQAKVGQKGGAAGRVGGHTGKLDQGGGRGLKDWMWEGGQEGEEADAGKLAGGNGSVSGGVGKRRG